MPTLTPASADNLTLAPVVDGGGYAGFYPSSSTYPSSSLYPGIEETGTASIAFGIASSGTVTAGQFTSIYPVEVFADNPVSYYRMDAATGTSEFDRGSLHHHGTYSNSPTLGVAGVLDDNTAVAFTRTSSQKLAGSDDDAYSLASGGKLSIECWASFSVSAVSSGTERMVSKIVTLADREWVIERSAINHFFRALASGGAFLTNAPFGIPSLNSFHHYVATMEDTSGTVTAKTYLDGALVTTATFALSAYAAGAGVVCVGGSDDATNFCNGTIDEVAIYSTCLSAERVLVHYNAGISDVSFTATSTNTLTLTPA